MPGKGCYDDHGDANGCNCEETLVHAKPPLRERLLGEAGASFRHSYAIRGSAALGKTQSFKMRSTSLGSIL